MEEFLALGMKFSIFLLLLVVGQLCTLLLAAITSPEGKEYKTGKMLRIKWNTENEQKECFDFLSVELSCQNGTVSLGMPDRLPVTADKYYWRIPYNFTPAPIDDCVVSLRGHSTNGNEQLEQSVPFSIVKGNYAIQMNEPTFDAEHNQIQVSWSNTDEMLNGKYYVLLMRKNYYKPVALLASKFSLNDKDAFSFDINPQFIQDGTKYYVVFADKIRNVLDARPEVSTKQLICTPILRKSEVGIAVGSIASQIEPQSPVTMAAKISQRKTKQAEKNPKKSLKKKKQRVGKKRHAKKNRKHPKKSKKEKKVKQIKAKGIQAINQAENKNDVKRHRKSRSSSFSWDSYSSSYSHSPSWSCCSYSSSCYDPSSSCCDPYSSCCDPSSSSCCDPPSSCCSSSSSEFEGDHRLGNPTLGTPPAGGIFNEPPNNNNQTSFPNNTQSFPGGSNQHPNNGTSTTTDGATPTNQTKPSEETPSNPVAPRKPKQKESENPPSEPSSENSALHAKISLPVLFGAFVAAFAIVGNLA